ncbi:hypothetical protein [Bradyrhizobium canariense]|uniref:Uncharacterized protein n=1 Tax=Bradyrhizobium canariense TaxID=255045 RepID=A0A1H2ATD0_9BRAD|nr:hypothetical protein [Bradyrhizobium canariense]SDT49037.1 hypothetical protein SAMN05444158_6442 [Bradyrhizobium canariense]
MNAIAGPGDCQIVIEHGFVVAIDPAVGWRDPAYDRDRMDPEGDLAAGARPVRGEPSA